MGQTRKESRTIITLVGQIAVPTINKMNLIQNVILALNNLFFFFHRWTSSDYIIQRRIEMYRIDFYYYFIAH